MNGEATRAQRTFGAPFVHTNSSMAKQLESWFSDLERQMKQDLSECGLELAGRPQIEEWTEKQIKLSWPVRQKRGPVA